MNSQSVLQERVKNAFFRNWRFDVVSNTLANRYTINNLVIMNWIISLDAFYVYTIKFIIHNTFSKQFDYFLRAT